MIADTITKIQQSADALRNARTRSPELGEFDYVRQGDLYVYRIPTIPDGCIREEHPSPQLVPGDTRGSRHCLATLDGVTIFRLPNPNPLQGPIVELAAQNTITHPEHGHIVLRAGRYAVTFQRSFAKDMALQRVAD